MYNLQISGNVALCFLFIACAVYPLIQAGKLREPNAPNWKKQACARENKNGQYNCTQDGDIECYPGWTGDLCNVPICKKGCHPKNGYCAKPDECKCKIGFSGQLCDSCMPLPGCMNGSCNKSFECSCNPGWDGLFCNLPVCRKGCHNIRGFCDAPGECKCRLGWSGENCTSCQVLPGCKNGYCNKPLECLCHEGWTGVFCQTPICHSNCSTEHGFCEAPGECRCKVGWYGEYCNDCFPYPGCVNGYCEKPWECKCRPGWTGFLCDKRIPYCVTEPNTCQNGGNCVSLTPEEGNFTCTCPAGFTGKRCEDMETTREEIHTSTAASVDATLPGNFTEDVAEQFPHVRRKHNRVSGLNDSQTI